MKETDNDMFKFSGLKRPRTALAAAASITIACMSFPIASPGNVTVVQSNIPKYASPDTEQDKDLVSVTDDLQHSGIDVLDSELLESRATGKGVLEVGLPAMNDAAQLVVGRAGSVSTALANIFETPAPAREEEEGPAEVYDFWAQEPAETAEAPAEEETVPEAPTGEAQEPPADEAAQTPAPAADEAAKPEKSEKKAKADAKAGKADDGTVYAVLMPASYSPDVQPVLVTSKDGFSDYQVIDIDEGAIKVEGDNDREKLVSQAKGVAELTGVPVNYTLFIDDYDLKHIQQTMDALATPHIVVDSTSAVSDKKKPENVEAEAPAEDKNTEPTKFQPVPDDAMWYDQNAYPGFDYQYGFDIPGYGCGLCATTVAVNQATGQTLDPPAVASAMQSWSDANGGYQYCTWGGTDWGPWKEVVQGAFGLKVDKVETLEDARAALERGAVIVSGNDWSFRCSLGGWYYTDSHVICFYKTDGSSFFAKDSAGSLGGGCIEYTAEDLEGFWPGASNRSYAVYAA